MADGSAYRHRNDCRLCGGDQLSQVISLVPTPPANAFVSPEFRNIPQPAFPLDIFFCERCKHVQLLDVVDPCILFEHYVYVSGTSPVFVKHFEDYARDLLVRFAGETDGIVVDIGSNDGTLLRAFQDAGRTVQGIDPAIEIAEAATKAGIPTLNGFFSAAMAGCLFAEHGPAAIITANNVMAHIDNLSDVLTGVRILLADDGVFAFEVSYLGDVIENVLFDTIYHEHLDYHSVLALQPFLAAHDLEIIDVVKVPSHGGSIRVIAQPKGGSRTVSSSVATVIAAERRQGLDQAETFRQFGAKIDAVGEKLKYVLAAFKAEGKIIAGFGAPAKATTLMHHFAIGPETIDFIIDDSPLKQGLYTPGMHIPVMSSQALIERKPDILVILAWNFAPSIIERTATFQAGGGQYVVPLPQVEVI